MIAAREAQRAATVLLFAGLALGGCALGPRPEAPVPPAPTTWNGQSGTACPWPAQDWWRAYGSIELDRLIEAAQAHNTDIARTVARMRQADAQARVAGAALLPTLGVQPSVAAIRSISPAGNLRRYGTLSGVATASYELDLWGRLGDGVDAARNTVQAATLEIAVVRMGVTSGVASAYFQLLAVQDQMAFATADVETARQILAGLRMQQRRGLTTGLAVEQQKVLVAQNEAAVPPLEVRRVHLVDALAILTGRVPVEVRIDGGSLETLNVPSVGAGLPSDLLLHRPDVQEAERNLAAADADISVARKSFLPSIALTGSGGVGSVALSSVFNGPTSVFNLGASILQPIFAGGRLRGDLDHANARYEELAADYLGAVRGAFADTEDALAETHWAGVEVVQRRAVLAAAQRAVEMAEVGFTAGTVDRIALLIAQRQLTAARNSYAVARLSEVLGTVSLYKALGGGWRSATSATSLETAAQASVAVAGP